MTHTINSTICHSCREAFYRVDRRAKKICLLCQRFGSLKPIKVKSAPLIACPICHKKNIGYACRGAHRLLVNDYGRWGADGFTLTESGVKLLKKYELHSM